MMDSSPSRINTQLPLPQVAGVKRSAPTLLPAFEPLSSSPGLPRPSKRQAREASSKRDADFSKYPTPVPTSTTGILSSSPPRGLARPGLQRTQSVVSERAPLSAVPCITLPKNGDELLMGRSSNSSHYQLSANRLISRVHVKARYIPASSSLEPNKIEIICNGWNGIKLHCQARTWDLARGDSFTSETESAEIMIDVQDARVRIAWPSRERRVSVSSQTDSSWDEEGSPSRRNIAVSSRGHVLDSSPMPNTQRLASPVSPSPAGHSSPSPSLPPLLRGRSAENAVQVYEDESSSGPVQAETELSSQSQLSTQVASQPLGLGDSQSSGLTDPVSDAEDDHNEENDPIIHSFGPFGANILSGMASFNAGASPEQPRKAAFRSPSPAPAPAPASRERSDSASTNDADLQPVVNHAVNQLAFSRLSSTPLSVILSNLPADMRGLSPSHSENRGLTKNDLRKLLEVTPCVGEIHREGKDAAGKALESEYYYMADCDKDEQRRAAVVDGLRKPSLRNCRKQHKVSLDETTTWLDTSDLPCSSTTGRSQRREPEL